jgi:hypothetical protein
MGQPEVYIQATSGFIDANGQIGAACRELLQTWMHHFAVWVRRMQPNLTR